MEVVIQQLTAGVRSAWKKFREYLPILTGKGFSLHCALSLAAQCMESVLSVCVFVGLLNCLWVSYHVNSKLHSSIFTKLDL